MKVDKNILKANRDWELLAPFFAQKLRVAIAECQAEGYPVELFEGYRSGERQEWLYESGRTRDGKIITYARAGESDHNIGIAADCVFKINGSWTWEGDFDRVEQIMLKHGLKSLKFERCHFFWPKGISTKRAHKIAQERGLLALWSIVESES